jgi:hypothetical protein
MSGGVRGHAGLAKDLRFDLLHAMQWRPAPLPLVRADGPLNDHLRVTVADRRVSLLTAAYGTRLAGPAITTMLRTWRRRLAARREGDAVLGDHRFVDKSPQGSRQPGGETRTPLRPSPSSKVRGL